MNEWFVWKIHPINLKLLYNASKATYWVSFWQVFWSHFNGWIGNILIIGLMCHDQLDKKSSVLLHNISLWRKTEFQVIALFEQCCAWATRLKKVSAPGFFKGEFSLPEGLILWASTNIAAVSRCFIAAFQNVFGCLVSCSRPSFSIFLLPVNVFCRGSYSFCGIFEAPNKKG